MKMWICGEALTWNSTGTTIYSTYENGLDEIKIISHKKASTWYWKCLTTVARLLLNISHLWKQSREDTCSSEMKEKAISGVINSLVRQKYKKIKKCFMNF